MFDRIDPHPERRGAQIAWARTVLRGCPDSEPLRRACAVLLVLSDDPYDRTLATELLRCVEHVPSSLPCEGGLHQEGERSVARAGGGSEADEPRRGEPLSRMVAVAGSR